MHGPENVVVREDVIETEILNGPSKDPDRRWITSHSS
jgi:hypothetical protein